MALKGTAEDTLATGPQPAVQETPLIPGADGGKRRESYFEGLQCLRFLAAAMVVVSHGTFYASERLSPAFKEWPAGTAGVNLFFVISGFVMMSTAPKFQREANGWRTFALRRLARIVPLYWFMTTIKVAIMLAAASVVLHARLDWPFILKSYFFIPAINSDGEIRPLVGVGWTLLFEMAFYLLCTIGVATRIDLFRFCAPVLLLCAALSLVVPSDTPATMYFNPIMLEFLFGMAIAKWGTGVRAPRALCWALICAGLAVLLFRPFVALGSIMISRSIPAAMLVLGTVWLEPHVRRFPRSLVFLGAASYSLYLVHPFVGPIAPTILAKLHIVSLPLSVLGTMLAAIVGSMVSFVLIERPVGDWLSRMIASGGARSVGVPKAVRQDG